MVKSTGRGLVEKRPGVLSKVEMLTLVLGVGVFSLLPTLGMLVQLLHPYSATTLRPSLAMKLGILKG